MDYDKYRPKHVMEFNILLNVRCGATTVFLPTTRFAFGSFGLICQFASEVLGLLDPCRRPALEGPLGGELDVGGAADSEGRRTCALYHLARVPT